VQTIYCSIDTGMAFFSCSHSLYNRVNCFADSALVSSDAPQVLHHLGMFVFGVVYILEQMQMATNGAHLLRRSLPPPYWMTLHFPSTLQHQQPSFSS